MKMKTKSATIYFDDDGRARFVTWYIDEIVNGRKVVKIRVKVFRNRSVVNLCDTQEEAIKWAQDRI